MSSPLELYLRKQIQKDGPLPLGAFIEMALCHPQHGYYMTRDPFGVAGDFTTAPEISQVFGELIGAWIVDIWQKMGEPEKFNVIECGPGRGTLMSDILRVVGKIPGFLDSASITLVETSPVLKDSQRKILESYDIKWSADIESLNITNPAIIIGNEFLDALPIEHLKKEDEGWKQKFVGIKDGEFVFCWESLQPDLKDHLPKLTVSNQVYEVSPARHRYITQCAELLNQNTGVGLFIDYGHIKTHFGDTLQAVKNHSFTDILSDIGDCDLTSHVDFESLSESVKRVGCVVHKITTQSYFLESLGVEQRLEALKRVGASPQLNEGVARLVDADKMGDLFKVFCFHHGYEMNVSGVEK